MHHVQRRDLPLSGAAASVRTAPHPALILFTLWFVVFSTTSQLNVVVPLLPRIGEAFAIPEVLRGTLVSAYAITLSGVALLGGPLSDSIGRRRILLLGCTGMAIALFLHAIAYSYLSLFILRALAGVAGGMLSGSSVAYIGDYFPPQKRGWATGYVLSAIAFSQMIGIPAGTLLAGAFDFHWSFVLFALAMVLATALVWRFLPPVDHGGAPARFTPTHLVASYRRLLRAPGVPAAVIANLLSFATLSTYLVYLPAWLEHTLAFSSQRVAALFFVGGIATALASPLAGRLSDRWGRGSLMRLAHLSMGVLSIASGFMAASTWAVFVVFTAVMFAYALRNIAFQPLLTTLVPGHQRGTLTSLSFSAGNVGMGLGSLVAGVVYSGHGFLGNSLVAAASSAVLALIAHLYFTGSTAPLPAKLPPA